MTSGLAQYPADTSNSAYFVRQYKPPNFQTRRPTQFPVLATTTISLAHSKLCPFLHVQQRNKSVGHTRSPKIGQDCRFEGMKCRSRVERSHCSLGTGLVFSMFTNGYEVEGKVYSVVRLLTILTYEYFDQIGRHAQYRILHLFLNGKLPGFGQFQAL